jgi:hypothetical protein
VTTARSLHRRVVSLVALTGIAAVLIAAGHALAINGVGAAVGALELDPLLGVAELVRLTALVVTAWLALVTLVDTLASIARLHHLASAAQRLAPRFWRQVALKPVSALAVAVPPVLMPVAAITPAAAQVLAIETAEPESWALDGRTLTMIDVGHRHDPANTEPVRELTMRTHVLAEPEPVQPPPAPPPVAEPTPSGTTHVVVAGDNLWSIAAAHLTEVQGERPTQRQVTPYWRALIEANRDRLPDPSNPDLLFPGVHLVLPPAP